ncbi:hypothetical protein [Candidatus Lokiarchaeum ossiferum]|uniref:hypothetical protein n=1 Tax=Candidatus Lokiarchaeum ossiferum TaxID=2951803 RepID=UPI00352D16F6
MEESTSINIKRIKYLIYAINITFSLTIILAWIFYPDTYRFFFHYISELGSTTTKLGTPNRTSQIIFSIGTIMSGTMAILMAEEYLKLKNRNPLNILKGISLIIVYLGALTTIFSYDVPAFEYVHRFGAGFFVLMLFIYNALCQFLRYQNGTNKISVDTQESRNMTGDKIFLLFILLCFVAYFLVAIIGLEDYQPMIQKIVLIVILISNFILDDEDY